MTLDDTRAEAWSALAAAVADRDAPLRLLTLATVADGAPDLRTVVLRGVDASAWRLVVHTDIRSAKVAQLRLTPAVALHGWDPARRLQLRLYGTATLHSGDGEARAAWQGLPALGQQIYRVRQTPGTVLPDPSATQFDEGGAASGFAAFAVVTIAVARLETLLLTGHGQQRARFTWGDGGAEAAWLVP